jgi:EAL domain-containing protein (putative c-di-GMP-specific phosphodiesterase class I)/GGDEF domain-containing protein
MTSRIANAFEIRKNIYTDALTGLPNIKKIRPIIIDKLIASEPFSLILCKIVNLKEIVITRGDEVVDNSIISITKRITAFVSAQAKNCLISRNSGEASFIFLYPNTNEKKIRAFSKELIASISRPIRISGNTIKLEANVGVCNSTDIWDSDMIFNYSKLAIQSITDQKNAVCIFDAKMQRDYSYDKELEDHIRAAISSKQFVSHYQPKVLCDGRICGFEALVRWSRNDTIEYPNVFIDKIEKMGMIQDLFDIVLDKICSDFAGSKTLSSVSINISPLQLANKDLPSKIISCISTYGIDPSRFTFELVETAIVNAEYHSTITELKNLGFKLSLDDFGTGYARYQTLISLFDQGFINELKIDKVFIDNIASPAYQNFISSISYLTREFDIRIVIEGVETMHQYSLLKQLNPEVIIQGWLVSKALPLNKANQLSEKAIMKKLSELDP